MRLERSSDQRRQTLDEFYEEWARPDAEIPELGRGMLDLIAALRAHPDPRVAWGLTSLATLCLLSQDTWKSPWYVRISSQGVNGFLIGYLMPPASAPWPDAYVQGEAKTINDAVAMVLLAMDRSEGWG